ncbi:MAG: hypothetical protein Q7S40_27725 [Opitutaceae bacterium]|nr:hypothetical protein [Opitutaceae bacterium]
MKHCLSPLACLITLLAFPSLALAASPGPWDGANFKGRIAHSADGNANDEDDWGAFPVAFAMIDAFGLMDRVVHVDYNNILQTKDDRFYREMTDSVRGSIERYRMPASVMFDCQKDLEGAIESIRKAINASSADNPLYYILAGPMEVPLLGIKRSDPAKRKHIYCISHSVWNDGYAQPEKLHLHKYTKRDIIETGVNWVQVKPGNLLADSTRTSSTPEQWAKWQWMRDSADQRLGWIFSRLQVEGRCDVSDATMTYFLLTGDEEATTEKLKALLDDKQRPTPVSARNEIRIEAENFQRLENFMAERRNDRTASHRVSVQLSGAKQGSITGALNQPFAPSSGQFDVEVRYFDGKQGRSEYKLMVGGAQRGDTWTASADTDSWQSRMFKGLAIKAGDEIKVVVKADGAETPKLDYVQFNAASAARNAPGTTRSDSRPSHARFTATGPLDVKDALPGQIIVAGKTPGYLKYNGGGPAFLCGPDNPELFLFLGELNKDGTRSKGEQQRIIDRLVASGANAFHVILWRMNRSNIKNEGDDKHCPFVDHDPAKPLNDAVLAQWEGWIAQFEAAGVVVHVDFYDDATDVEKIGWTLDKDGNLHPDEHRFIEGIVNRWKRLKNIVWSVGESVNKLPRTQIPHIMKTTELIAKTDNHHHPIILSFVAPDTGEKDIGKDFVYPGDFYSDPNVHLITWLHVLPHGDDYEAQHEAYLRWSRVGYGRFIMMKNETERFPRTQPQSRIYMWSSVMTGQHTMESGHDVLRRGNLLDADGHIARFMEQTDFHTMQPSDSRAAQSTKWVLAGRDSYIAYTYAYEGAMGLKGLRAGNYRLLWLDTVTGKSVTRDQVSVSGGEAAWQKPAELGNELALYVKRHGS